MFKFVILIVLSLNLQLSFAEHIEEPVVVEEATVVEVEDPYGQGVVVEIDDTQPERDPPVIDEEEFKKQRESAGILNIENTDSSFTAYKFREEGVFLISKESFSDTQSAKGFCDSVSDFTEFESGPYEIITPHAGLLLAFMGLPFGSLQSTSIIYKPVIEYDGKRTGVTYWTSGFQGQIENDKVLALTDGNGAGAGDFVNLEKLNSNLIEAGLEALSMPAVCVGQKLKGYIKP